MLHAGRRESICRDLSFLAMNGCPVAGSPALCNRAHPARDPLANLLLSVVDHLIKLVSLKMLYLG